MSPVRSRGHDNGGINIVILLVLIWWVQLLVKH